MKCFYSLLQQIFNKWRQLCTLVFLLVLLLLFPIQTFSFVCLTFFVYSLIFSVQFFFSLFFLLLSLNTTNSIRVRLPVQVCTCQQKLVMLMLTCYRRQSVFWFYADQHIPSLYHMIEELMDFSQFCRKRQTYHFYGAKQIFGDNFMFQRYMRKRNSQHSI